MHAQPFSAIALALLCSASAAAQEPVWFSSARPTASFSQPAASPVRLGRPAPLTTSDIQPVSYSARAQAPDPFVPPPPPPPPNFPGAGDLPPPPGGPSPFECGTVNSNADQGGFFSRCGDKLRRGWDGLTGGVSTGATELFQPGQGRTAFSSDHCFDYFISPVSNPRYFEDPRALTELRPVFMWQHTPSSNPVFAGGDNFFFDLQTRVAFTPWLSLVINEFGYTWTEIEGVNQPYDNHAGFSEVHLGPKFTFLRSECTKTIMAGGLTFEIPTGPAKVFQNTGNLSLTPYLSLAQNFWQTQFGSMNFMNTTGYRFATDNERTDSIFSSFHLDYDVLNAHVFYPLIELNWTNYTRSGNVRPFNFEGSNLFNFGSTNVGGLNELTLAIGFRYLVSQCLQFGIAPEFNVLSNTGGRHLDKFRLTADMIFRY
jgi:hypothetical protein